MPQIRFSRPKALAAAFAVLLSTTGLTQAGPYTGAESVAIPGGQNTNFAQLKQISGFTGHLNLAEASSGYEAVGTSFNKFIKLRFTVDCPQGYGVHEAGIRVKGDDVVNYNFEIVGPGDVAFDQNTWSYELEQEPWKFDAVVDAGGEALEDAGTSGPVYVSLDKVLDSRTEFYASCDPSQPSSGLPFLYYDSTDDDGHMRPMTRVRYELLGGVRVAPALQLKTPAMKAAVAPQRQLGRLLRQRARSGAVAVQQAPQRPVRALLAPGGCPYDCPPPAATRRLAR